MSLTSPSHLHLTKGACERDVARRDVREGAAGERRRAQGAKRLGGYVMEEVRRHEAVTLYTLRSEGDLTRSDAAAAVEALREKQ